MLEKGAGRVRFDFPGVTSESGLEIISIKRKNEKIVDASIRIFGSSEMGRSPIRRILNGVGVEFLLEFIGNAVSYAGNNRNAKNKGIRIEVAKSSLKVLEYIVGELEAAGIKNIEQKLYINDPDLDFYYPMTIVVRAMAGESDHLTWSLDLSINTNKSGECSMTVGAEFGYAREDKRGDFVEISENMEREINLGKVDMGNIFGYLYQHLRHALSRSIYPLVSFTRRNSNDAH